MSEVRILLPPPTTHLARWLWRVTKGTQVPDMGGIAQLVEQRHKRKMCLDTYAGVVQRQRHEPQKLVSVGSNPTPSTRVGVPQSEKLTSHQGTNCGVINRGP